MLRRFCFGCSIGKRPGRREQKAFFTLIAKVEVERETNGLHWTGSSWWRIPGVISLVRGTEGLVRTSIR